MLLLQEFRDYIKLLETDFAEITASEVVMDDSQISKFLEDQVLDDVLIVGIIPKHKPFGTLDNLKSLDQTSILVLKKVDRRDDTHEDFLDTIQNMQGITKLITDRLLDDANDDDSCGFMRYIAPSSFDINPIGWLNSCDGYQIDFSLHTNF